MRKNKHSYKKSNKKEVNMQTKKVIAIIAVLVIAYLVINSLIPDKTTDTVVPKKQNVYQSCEERCVNNDECLNDCYITDINIAVLNSDVNACNKIPLESSKQLCLDKVNLKLDKCDLIQDTSLKNTCLENAQ